MDLFLSILAVICGAAGIIGAVLPVVPGPALSYFGMLCAYWTDTSTLTSGKMWLWGVVTAVVTALDYILPAYFSKMFGGSRAGIIGATVGVFAGMILLGPLGIVLGPFVGAVAGELLHDRENADKALKVGFGSLVSFFVGSGMKIAVSTFMMYYIWKDMTAVLDSMW